jgi:outer membrane protein assembly factor BamB
MVGKPMKKHIISFMILFLLVSTSLVGVSNQVTVDASEVPSDGGLQDSAWPMFHHDTKHTGRSPFGPAGNWPVEKWKFKMQGAVLSSPAIDKNGTLYIGADGDDCLFAINPDGTERWRANIGNALSSPAIGSDGTIYIGTVYGKLYAINPNGTEKWQVILETTSWAYSSPVISEDDIIYMASVDSNKLFAIYLNGTIKWSFETNGWIYSSPALSDDGTIYIGSNDGCLYAINPNGTLKWKYNTGKDVQSDPSIDSNGIIYFGSWDGYLYALYPNGTLVWKFNTMGAIESSPALCSDGAIVIGSSSDNLYCLNPNGTLQWSFHTGNDILSSPTIDAHGTIYCGSYDDYLYAINKNGTLRWKFDAADHGIESSQVIAEDGTIYISGHFPPSGSQLAYSLLHAIQVINDSAPSTPMITGTENGKVRRQYDYTIVSTDPEDDNISYYIDWGDGKITDWTGPYDSSEEIIQSHTWLIRGTYEVKVKARDGPGMESEWGTLSVTMPYEPQFPFVQWLLVRFPNAFPILRFLLEYD